jgi:hypothetical protein
MQILLSREILFATYQVQPQTTDQKLILLVLSSWTLMEKEKKKEIVIERKMQKQNSSSVYDTNNGLLVDTRCPTTRGRFMRKFNRFIFEQNDSLDKISLNDASRRASSARQKCGLLTVEKKTQTPNIDFLVHSVDFLDKEKWARSISFFD